MTLRYFYTTFATYSFFNFYSFLPFFLYSFLFITVFLPFYSFFYTIFPSLRDIYLTRILRAREWFEYNNALALRTSMSDGDDDGDHIKKVSSLYFRIRHYGCREGSFASAHGLIALSLLFKHKVKTCVYFNIRILMQLIFRFHLLELVLMV